MPLLPNPHEGKLLMHRYVQICVLTNVHFHNRTLLKCMYIGSEQFKGTYESCDTAIYRYSTVTWVYF